ncbi:hypothetical protein AB0D13_08980 [Streptomyces sp. NPDC048430]|uniref:hypothetical protein n=1 Tax=Streptomyces sp. NPDC048430 TaxID=3155388 RepID=UPI00341E6E17
MSKKTPYPSFALTAELVAAATALYTLFEALKAAGFSEAQAFAIARDAIRPVGVSA